MHSETKILSGPMPGVERVLGRVSGTQAGPTLIAIGGLHGNETAGILATRRVLSILGDRGGPTRGEFVALSGNRAALALDRRYLSRDLNRSWTTDRMGASSWKGIEPEAEDEEQEELLRVLESVTSRARGPVYLLDLHTTSGPGRPFTTIMDSLPNRRFALRIPVPLIVGLGELVEGTLMEYLADRGVAAIVFEGGQHRDPASVVSTEAAIWLALAGAGLITPEGFPEVDWGRNHLASATRDLPRVLEMRYRHPVRPEDDFTMLPGFGSFQNVAAGQTLARDRAGEIRSPERGRLLLPLYQAQGDDGFFIVREFHPFWLRLSEVLRRLGMSRLMHWLPGVRKDPEGPHRLLVDRRVARWYTMEILHLLGYWRKVEEGDRLVVLRQRDGTAAPWIPDRRGPERPGGH